MTDDWNPNDPEATRVHYDLESWSFEQMAELAAALADAVVPHAWDGNELIVPESAELATDDIVAQVEMRLGMTVEVAEAAPAKRFRSPMMLRRPNTTLPNGSRASATWSRRIWSLAVCRSGGRTMFYWWVPPTRNWSIPSSTTSRTTKASTWLLTATTTTPTNCLSKR